MAKVGTWGGPQRALSQAEQQRFLAGRAEFDRDATVAEGLGGPRFNGDSCRACHFGPVVGGAGPRGVNVIRHGFQDPQGRFVPPSVGTVLHRMTLIRDSVNRPQKEATIYEHRQTPHLFGLGLIEAIPAETILAAADPKDSNGDGISGRPSWVDGGRLGRFGWKAQVPSVAEFVRDAITTELGMTLPWSMEHTFGRVHDNDTVPDPEFGATRMNNLGFYLSMLGAPPRTETEDKAQVATGEQAFMTVGCGSCHTPKFQSPLGPVRLYSDLLLHEILPAQSLGIEEAGANVREFRTPPLWGIARTAPYLHSGAADTLDQAIRMHDGESLGVRGAYEALPAATRSALLSFLRSL